MDKQLISHADKFARLEFWLIWDVQVPFLLRNHQLLEIPVLRVLQVTDFYKQRAACRAACQGCRLSWRRQFFWFFFYFLFSFWTFINSDLKNLLRQLLKLTEHTQRYLEEGALLICRVCRAEMFPTSLHRPPAGLLLSNWWCLQPKYRKQMTISCCFTGLAQSRLSAAAGAENTSTDGSDLSLCIQSQERRTGMMKTALTPSAIPVECSQLSTLQCGFYASCAFIAMFLEALTWTHFL